MDAVKISACPELSFSFRLRKPKYGRFYFVMLIQTPNFSMGTSFAWQNIFLYHTQDILRMKVTKIDIFLSPSNVLVT